MAPIVASHRGQLGWWLAAPPPPGARPARPSGRRRLWRLLRLGLLALLPLDLLLLAALVALAAIVAAVAAAAALLVLAGYLVYRAVNRRAIAEREAERSAARRRYERALACWHRLAYCHRCQGVFLPGGGGPPARAAVAPAWHAWSLAEHLANAEDQARDGRPPPRGIEYRR